MSENKPLPPDPEGMNDERAQWAHEGLKTFAVSTGIKIDVEADTVASGFLADVMHWCDRHRQDFDSLLARARNHYAEETKDGE